MDRHFVFGILSPSNWITKQKNQTNSALIPTDSSGSVTTIRKRRNRRGGQSPKQVRDRHRMLPTTASVTLSMPSRGRLLPRLMCLFRFTPPRGEGGMERKHPGNKGIFYQPRTVPGQPRVEVWWLVRNFWIVLICKAWRMGILVAWIGVFVFSWVGDPRERRAYEISFKMLARITLWECILRSTNINGWRQKKRKRDSPPLIRRQRRG